MSFDLLEIWSHMGPAAKLINGVMAIMSVYSLSIMIERWLTFQKAKGQSRGYSVRIAKELKAGNIDSAIKVSQNKDVKNSHLAKVLLAGLQRSSTSPRKAARAATRWKLPTGRSSGPLPSA